MQPDHPETVLHRKKNPRSILLLRIATLSAMLAVTTACINDSSGDESTAGNSSGSSTDGSSTDGSSTDGSSTDGSSTNGSSTGDSSTDDSSTDDSSTDDSSTDDSSTDDSASSVDVDITFSPEDQSRNVSFSRTVSFRTDTALDPASVDSDSFILEGPNGEVSGEIVYSDGTVELEPDDDLALGTSYTMTVTNDILTDDGASIANNHYASFTTVTASALPPKFDEWEENMVEYGHKWGKALQNETDYLDKFKIRYYDGQRVNEQIGEYLGETQPWRDYGQEAESNYKKYLENNDFRTAGWQRFPHGLYLDWKRTGDTQSRDYLKPLRDNPPFSDPINNSYSDDWVSVSYSREVAYSIQSQIVAERAGYPRQTQRLEALVDLALGHIDRWVTQSSNYIQPFMAGLTASAMIEYYERSVKLGNPDTRVVPALTRLGNHLWEETWVPNVGGSGYGAFIYDNDNNSPAPDLNLLIAPMYSWLYLQTGDAKWLQRGDAIFAGGVEMANLNSGKRFNQSYRSSFNFVDWRSEGVEKYGSQ